MDTLCFLDKCLAKFEIAAVVILLATAAVLNFIQVVARYFLNLSFNALEEISVYFIIALVFVGLMRADRNRQNISIDIIHNYLSPSAANILWTIADGFLCITALSLAYFTSQSVIFSHIHFTKIVTVTIVMIATAKKRPLFSLYIISGE